MPPEIPTPQDTSDGQHSLLLGSVVLIVLVCVAVFFLYQYAFTGEQQEEVVRRTAPYTPQERTAVLQRLKESDTSSRFATTSREEVVTRLINTPSKTYTDEERARIIEQLRNK